MGKGTARLESINQQNELLREQNNLLREQNDLLRQQTSGSRDDNREIFIADIERDEMRNGFLVTSHRKKLWNVQLNLIKEFDRICRKHNLRWFAFAGTLLGAARHKGFVPWDDDVDVAMLRPDYEKFRKIAVAEIKSPYLLDCWYDYRFENDEPSELTDNSLPLIKLEHYKRYPLAISIFPVFPIIKIRDTRTLHLEHPGVKSFNQSIFLDIFPLDSLSPFQNENQKLNFEVNRILYIAATRPELIKDAMQKNQRLIVDYESLQKFMRLPYKLRCLQMEENLAKSFFMSEHIGEFRYWCIEPKHTFYQSKDFADVTYLPFEKIELPAPVGYESALTDYYGDWRKPVFQPSHGGTYSTDISWAEYLQHITQK